MTDDEDSDESEEEDTDECVVRTAVRLVEVGDLQLRIQEVVSAAYGLYTWPSAGPLARYIWDHRNSWKGRRVVELGAGTALPSVVAAAIGCPTTISDNQTLVLENAAQTCSLNAVECDVMCLPWGEASDALLALSQPERCPSLLLGSDCFYDSKEFDDLLFTVSYFFSKNPRTIFVTTYQERNVDRSIWHLLRKWGMDIMEVPLLQGDALFSEEELDSVHLLVIWLASGGTPAETDLRWISETG